MSGASVSVARPAERVVSYKAACGPVVVAQHRAGGFSGRRYGRGRACGV